MASPVAHSLAAAAVALAVLPRRGAGSWPLVVVLGAVIGNLPDLDFAPVVLLGLPQATLHRTATHSLVAVVALGLLLAPWLARRLSLHRWRAAILVALAGASHIALDLLVADPLPPVGVQFLWPFSRTFFPPWPLLPMLDLDLVAAFEFREAALAPMVEALVFGPFAILAVLRHTRAAGGKAAIPKAVVAAASRAESAVS